MTTTVERRAAWYRRPPMTVPAVAGPWAVAGVAAVGCLILGLVDPTRTALVPPCPFKALTGLDCPGCGTTRAMHQLFTGHPGAALGLNAAAMLAIPVVAWWWVAWALRSSGRPVVAPPRIGPRLRLGLVVALVAFTVLRNLPLAPFGALGT